MEGTACRGQSQVFQAEQEGDSVCVQSHAFSITHITEAE